MYIYICTCIHDIYNIQIHIYMHTYIHDIHIRMLRSSQALTWEKRERRTWIHTERSHNQALSLPLPLPLLLPGTPPHSLPWRFSEIRTERAVGTSRRHGSGHPELLVDLCLLVTFSDSGVKRTHSITRERILY